MAIDAPPRIDAGQDSDERVEAFPPGYGDPGLRWLRMHYDEFTRLPEKPKHEWFDGWTVIHVDAPLPPHMYASRNLARALYNALPELEVFQEWGLHLPNAAFIPDLIAFDPNEPDDVPPVLAVEVLSPSTRRHDLGNKAPRYLAVGIGQFWTADPKRREVVFRENAGDHWREFTILDADHPTATIAVGDYGTVTLDRAVIFPDRTPGPRLLHELGVDRMVEPIIRDPRRTDGNRRPAPN